MQDEIGAKTTLTYWDAQQDALPNTRWFSPFDSGTRALLRLIARNTAPGSSFLEIGCAPGKMLAYAAMKCGARVAGIDYSPRGISISRRFHRANRIASDLRAEDVMETSFAPASFDCVFSAGLVEHFDDPRPVVAKHVELARPGARIVVAIPNYGGIYGRMQAKRDPANLAIHNLAIMSPPALAELFDPATVESVEAFPIGPPSLWGVTLNKPLLQRAAGVIGNLLPVIPALAPCLAAVAIRRSHCSGANPRGRHRLADATRRR